MKTLRLFGLTLMAILLSVNFTSCSEDGDDPIKNPEKLVGEWFLVQEREWGVYDGEEYDDKYTYDINNPDSGDNKMVIKETSNENEFAVSYYYYNSSSEEWSLSAKEMIRIDGDKYIEVYEIEDDEYEEDVYTFKLKDNKLTLNMHDKDEDGEGYYEAIYQKK